MSLMLVAREKRRISILKHHVISSLLLIAYKWMLMVHIIIVKGFCHSSGRFAQIHTKDIYDAVEKFTHTHTKKQTGPSGNQGTQAIRQMMHITNCTEVNKYHSSDWYDCITDWYMLNKLGVENANDGNRGTGVMTLNICRTEKIDLRLLHFRTNSGHVSNPKLSICFYKYALNETEIKMKEKEFFTNRACIFSSIEVSIQ